MPKIRFSMRAEFPQSVKDAVAARVGWKCSFPGCPIPTTGPSPDDPNKPIILGEAAHIYAASNNGPRANQHLDETERSSISNAIWLCRHHARMIDKDPLLYSAQTLYQFKEAAERKAYEQLRDISQEKAITSDTFIALTNELLFSGAWLSVDDNTWVFQIGDFIEGNISRLQQISINYDKVASWNRFIAIESQGDGRPLEKFSWMLNDKNRHEILCQVGPKAPRQNPTTFGGDLAWDSESSDIVIKDGDFVFISGIEAALQSLQLLLSSQPGDWKESPAIGSNFSKYCLQYAEQRDLLDHLIKTELIRLTTVSYQTDSSNSIPELDFINQIIHVHVTDLNLQTKHARLYLEIEFGNFEHWKGEVLINVR